LKRYQLDLNDYQTLVPAYQGESDRSAIVLGGSFAEHYLATYIRHFMIDDPEIERLFETGPLSTFNTRINLAYAFRLISKELRDDLRLVKDIRNHFAHSPQLIDLEQPDIQTMIRKLGIYATLHAPTTPANVQKSSRDIFLYSIGMFVVFAHNAIVQKKALQT
jgi:Mannitol repressor